MSLEQHKTTYLLAWLSEYNGIPSAFFEHSTAQLCRKQSVVSLDMERDNHRVIVFCDYLHGEDILSSTEMMKVAECYIDGNYNTHDIDLKY